MYYAAVRNVYSRYYRGQTDPEQSYGVSAIFLVSDISVEVSEMLNSRFSTS